MFDFSGLKQKSKNGGNENLLFGIESVKRDNVVCNFFSKPKLSFFRLKNCHIFFGCKSQKLSSRLILFSFSRFWQQNLIINDALNSTFSGSLG